MPPDAGILTAVLNAFIQALSLGYARTGAEAQTLLYYLMVIELCLSIGISAIWSLSLGFLISRLVVMGMTIWLVYNFPDILDMVMQSFIQLGLMVSGSSNIVVELRDPSAIISQGFHVTQPIAEYLSNISLWNSLINILDIGMMGLSLIGILTAYFFIAFQVFITYLSFTIISSFFVIFVPFLCLTPTSHLFDYVVTTVVAFGIRFTVLAAIITIGSAVIGSFDLPPDPTWRQAFNLLSAAGAMALLAWHAPTLAASALGSSAGLAVSHVAGGAVAGGEAAKQIKSQAAGGYGTTKQMASIMAASTVAVGTEMKQRMRGK